MILPPRTFMCGNTARMHQSVFMRRQMRAVLCRASIPGMMGKPAFTHRAALCRRRWRHHRLDRHAGQPVRSERARRARPRLGASQPAHHALAPLCGRLLRTRPRLQRVQIHNGVNNSVEGFGWVVRGADTVIFAKDIDIVAYTEIDSASTCGGHITMHLADGEVFESELTAVAPG